MHGVSVKSEGGLPLEISGKLQSGIYEIRGDISSQYITGLLLALPVLDGDSEIRITTELQSQSYVDMTLRVLALYGIEVRKTDSIDGILTDRLYASSLCELTSFKQPFSYSP